jgi:hypothetical protein
LEQQVKTPLAEGMLTAVGMLALAVTSTTGKTSEQRLQLHTTGIPGRLTSERRTTARERQ